MNSTRIYLDRDLEERAGLEVTAEWQEFGGSDMSVELRLLVMVSLLVLLPGRQLTAQEDVADIASHATRDEK